MSSDQMSSSVWDSGFALTVVLPTISTIVLFVLSVNIVKYLMTDSHLHVRDVSKNHNWTIITGSNKVTVKIKHNGTSMLIVTLTI